MYEESVSYMVDGKNCIGHLVAPEKTGQRRPAVLIAHAWMGRDDFALQKARELDSRRHSLCPAQDAELQHFPGADETRRSARDHHRELQAERIPASGIARRVIEWVNL